MKYEINKNNAKITAYFVFSLAIVLVLFTSFVINTIAAPPDSKYTPGETLQPNCAPGDTNCTINYITVDSSNNVGVGTSFPSSSLHVIKTTEQLRLGYDDDNYTSFTIASDGGMTLSPTNNATTTIGAGLNVNSNTLVVDDSNSFVGVGTETPETELHVVSSGAAVRGLTIGQHQTGAGGTLINYKKSNGSYAGPSVVNNGDFIGLFSFQPYNGDSYSHTAWFGAKVNGTVSGGNVPTDLFFATGQNNDSGVSNIRMTVKSDGNVGIGEQTPQRTLHVNDLMRLEPRSSAPSSPALGDIYTDSDSNELCFYNGSSWTGLVAAGECS